MAMAVSFGIESWIEGGVIAAVVLLNIVVGYFQVCPSIAPSESHAYANLPDPYVCGTIELCCSFIFPYRHAVTCAYP